MIIWLASYPRSGNTLARMFIFRTLGVASTDRYTPDDPAKRRELADHPVSKGVGVFFPKMSWRKFYKWASASEETFLVKTHDPPPDDQPAIHIVRDGRKACLSYLDFHRAMHPDAGRTLSEIVLGRDTFGDWTGHYALWSNPGRRARGPRRRLPLRFEDLVDGGETQARAVANFIGHRGSVQPWVNPFDEFQPQLPHMFRRGSTIWENDPRWTPLINAQFALLHGPLMRNIGYWTQADVDAALRAVPAGAEELRAAAARARARAGAIGARDHGKSSVRFTRPSRTDNNR